MIVLPRPQWPVAGNAAMSDGGKQHCSFTFTLPRPKFMPPSPAPAPAHAHVHAHQHHLYNHAHTRTPPSPPVEQERPAKRQRTMATTTVTTMPPAVFPASPSSLPSPSSLASPPTRTLSPRAALPRLESLPSKVQDLIVSHLDYQTLIHLSITNRHFNRTIDPSAVASIPDKAEFIMRAAKDFPQHRPSEKGQDYRPGNFECYICFRVRAPDHFDIYQATTAWLDASGRPVRGREARRERGDREVALRRYCIECGVRETLHEPFDSLTTKTGRDLWVCLCRRVWSKPRCLRCPECRADCPLRPRRKA